VGSDIVRLGGRSIEVQTPSSLTEQVIKSVILPAVLQGAKALLRGAYELSIARVEMDAARQARITYINQYNSVLRTDVIPAIALSAAHQSGRTWAARVGLDEDLYQDALADMEARRQARRGL
jgi:hypothetical protein